MEKFVKKIGTIDNGVIMEKYISESDFKKYLDKQYKEAVRLRHDDGDDQEMTYQCQKKSYYQGRIDQINEIATELDL